MRIGLFASALTAAVLVTTFIGGYAAAATGETEPVRRARRPDERARAARRSSLVAIVVQGIAANISNVYTAGLSLVNSIPRARPASGDAPRRGGRRRALGAFPT